MRLTSSTLLLPEDCDPTTTICGKSTLSPPGVQHCMSLLLTTFIRSRTDWRDAKGPTIRQCYLMERLHVLALKVSWSLKDNSRQDC